MADTTKLPSIADLPKSWPFEEAQKVARRLEASGKSSALFETGYGPSGLPHIGTFGEVARTTWVRHAFTLLTGLPSRLLAFSDDMDGLRKVPDNVPNKPMLAQHLGKPLTRIPDPFGTHASFGAHNNAMLRSFLDAFGFDYDFASSTEYYASGRFDAALLRVLEKHDEILAVMLPTLGADRQATYSPILPVHPVTGIVMQAKIEKIDVAAGTVAWRDADGKWFETPVTGGACKLQWKADWAMRWHALGVDYEMSGKDLIDSVRLSGKICRIIGSEPPVGFTYELFLDEQAQKISKSKGNGLSVEEWLRYAPPESLAQFMFNQPQRAKRLYFDVIPKAVDEYLANALKAHAPAGERPRHQPGLAHPCRPRAAGGGEPAVVRHAAQPRQRGERGDAGNPVGLHPPLQPRRRRPRRCRSSPGWWNTRWPITATSCVPRNVSADASPDRGAPPCATSSRCCARCRRTAAPKTSRPRSTRWANAIRSRNCATGSPACTRCCWARRKARASASSWRSTAFPRRSA